MGEGAGISVTLQGWRRENLCAIADWAAHVTETSLSGWLPMLSTGSWAPE